MVNAAALWTTSGRMKSEMGGGDPQVATTQACDANMARLRNSR